MDLVDGAASGVKVSESRPRILVVGNYASAWPGGTPKVCEQLAAGLEREGHFVVRTSSVRSPLPRLFDMLQTSWLRRDAYDIAIIETYSTRGLLWAELTSIVVRAAKKPLVLSLHGGHLLEKHSSAPGRLSRHFARAQVLVSPSGYLASGFRDLGYPVHVVENPLAVDGLRKRVRRTCGPHALWARTFDDMYYNPHMAIRAFAEVVGHAPQARLIMAGPDRGAQDEVQALATALGVRASVEFPGNLRRSDLFDTMDKCDVFLHTSRVDNSPVSVAEAQAMGLCIIGTDVGGMRWVVRSGHDGLLVSSDDHRAMARAFTRVISEPRLASHLSENACHSAQKYAWSAVYQKWMDVFVRCGAERV